MINAPLREDQKADSKQSGTAVERLCSDKLQRRFCYRE